MSMVKNAAKAVKAAAEESGAIPRGLGSEESRHKVKAATHAVLSRYPGMTPVQTASYLAEVGAGRVMALYNFDAKESGPKKPAKKPAKKSAKKATKK